MTVLARRREAECASDLRLDRWLLGETPGSDEARQLEKHVAECADCASRLRSLRSLYSATVPVTTNVERPARVSAAGLLQVIILRDGLLVGTEMFTSGRWSVGGIGADLELEDLTADHRTFLTFHEGRLTVEVERGSVFVNGHRFRGGEVRPIDELCIGPWSLRTRLVNERWAERTATPIRAVAPLPEPKTEIVRLVSPLAPTVLKLELRWGDRLVGVRCFDVNEPVPPEVFDSKITVQDEGDRRRITWAGQTEVVGPHEPLCIETAGELRLFATMVAAPLKVPRAPVPVPKLIIVLSALFACVPVALSFVEPTDDDVMLVKPVLPIIHPTFEPPPKPSKPEPTPSVAHSPKAPTPSTGQKRPTRSPKLPDNLARVIQAATTVESALGRLAPSHGKSPGRSLVFGLPTGGGAIGIGLGVSTMPGAPRIGDAGLMGASRTGRGGVMARVTERAPRFSGDGASIDKDGVAKVLQAHTAEVSACYETALLTHEGLKGTARLEWRIDGTGLVTSARLLGGTLQDAGAVTACIIGKLKTWRFPPARGGQVIVSNNFVFQQAGY